MVVVLSGLSMPVAAAIAAVYLHLAGDDLGRLRSLVDFVGYEQAARRRRPVVGGADRPLRRGGARGALAGRTDDALPRPGHGVAGLAGGGRGGRRSRRARRPSSRGRSPSSARSQARLARDVHDVVGHSLAVILAQAESAQYLEDADTQRLKQTMANIATSARSSLQDVRQVLTPTPSEPTQPGSLDALIAGVRESGHEVVSSEVGNAATAATRARRGRLPGAAGDAHQRHQARPARRPGVRRAALARASCGSRCATWSSPAPRQAAPGHGLDGMRRRLESVGGRLDVRRRDEGGRTTFTATAWIPVRSR